MPGRNRGKRARGKRKFSSYSAPEMNGISRLLRQIFWKIFIVIVTSRPFNYVFLNIQIFYLKFRNHFGRKPDDLYQRKNAGGIRASNSTSSLKLNEMKAALSQPMPHEQGSSVKSNCSVDELNILLKGLLFAQEMFEDTDIKFFVEKYPEKYKFITGSLNEMPDYQESLFQGSTAEGLALFGIEELASECYYGNLRFDRDFDYDVMHIKSNVIIDQTEFVQNFCDFLNKRKRSQTMKSRLADWKQAKYCKHFEEKLVLFEQSENDTILDEYVGIFRPACDDCIVDDKSQRILKYEGRDFVSICPMKSLLECLRWRSKNHGNRKCECSSTEGHNRYGDLCDRCQETNTYKIKHGNHTESVSIMDKAFNSGPSIYCRFYMENKGETLPELPLFNEPGVGIVDVDSIVAYQYPFNVELGYKWPGGCSDFITRERRSGWPSMDRIKEVLATGCHLVPKRARKLGSTASNTWLRFVSEGILAGPMWRISFSAAEKTLAKAFTQPQRKCFLLLKALLRATGSAINSRLNEFHGEKKFEAFYVTSFVLKHVMFWTMEKVPQEEWRFNNLYSCLVHVLDQFEAFLERRCVPHYFFGARRNLLTLGYFKGTEAEHAILDEKVLVLSEGIALLKSRKGILESIYICFAKGGIDYQWNEKSSLINNNLVSSFAQTMVVIGRKQYRLSDVIAHHKSMINAIRKAPRRYGYGENDEFANFLENEISLLRRPGADLKILDTEERKTVVAAMKGEKEEDNTIWGKLWGDLLREMSIQESRNTQENYSQMYQKHSLVK